MFFTSDTHFYDRRLIRNAHVGNFALERANFLRVEDFNLAVLEHWNSVVSSDDLVYHLGDFAVYKNKSELDQVIELLEQLQFQKLILIKGNHDHSDFFKAIEKRSVLKDRIEIEPVGRIIKFGDLTFYLTHYPLLTGQQKNVFNLHGHLHSRSVSHKENLNVGIDSRELEYIQLTGPIEYGQPLSEPNILEILDGKKHDYQKRI